MSTLDQVRREIIAALQDAGIAREEALHEGHLILEDATGLSLARQHLTADQELDAPARRRIDELVQKRKQRIPLQYLLGYTWFNGLRFVVKPGVLIPRPETELLVEVACDFLKEKEAGTFIDVGTGSGAIAIAMLKCLPQWRCLAVDISSTAVAVAAENAQRHGVADRLTLVQSDWAELQCAPAAALISNPPYVPRSMAAELQPEVAVFEPKEAVFGTDADGLGFYRRLGKRGRSLLVADGLLALEVGLGQAEAVQHILRNDSWRAVRNYPDLNRISRVVAGLRPN